MTSDAHSPEWYLNNHPAENVRWMRRRLLMTQAEFGQWLDGQGQATIARCELGYTKPAPYFRRELLKRLKTLLDSAPESEHPDFGQLARLEQRG